MEVVFGLFSMVEQSSHAFMRAQLKGDGNLNTTGNQKPTEAVELHSTNVFTINWFILEEYFSY